jgi:hypothetical protein
MAESAATLGGWVKCPDVHVKVSTRKPGPLKCRESAVNS